MRESKPESYIAGVVPLKDPPFGELRAGSKQKKLGWGSRIVVALATCLMLALPSFAREWHITRFNSNMQVSQDGTMTVEERVTVYFNGEYHGIYRDIPIQYPGPRGSNYTLFL